jgi:aerobic C4-dicarboxylate transport protein
MRRISRTLYFWVLLAVVAGAIFGALSPSAAIGMKPLGDGFIKLIRMMVAPIVFCTIVTGIAQVRDLPRVGRVGLKALIYFELTSTVALGVGLLVANLARPGDGFHINPNALDATAVSQYASAAHNQSIVEFLLNIIPSTAVAALSSGEILQVLLLALLTGFGAALVGPKSEPVVTFIDATLQVLYKVVGLIMWIAPIGAFGAMAFTIGKFGWHSLAPLARFMGLFYVTCGVFVFGILGVVSKVAGFNIFRLAAYLKTELLTVLGTSSSESVLAQLIERLERLGCQRTTVGLVVPTGYSFNLDGTAIYLSLAAIFLAQAIDAPLSLGQQLAVLVVAMVTSKGAATVTGGGFITLAATLTAVPSVPVAALAIILGIDRFMSEARSLTNLMGNAVATLVVSRLEGEVTGPQLAKALSTHGTPPIL